MKAKHIHYFAFLNFQYTNITYRKDSYRSQTFIERIL